MNSTKIDSEVEKFSQMATQWWDLNGKFKILHRFNSARIDFMKNCLVEFNIPCPADILDIGCGGGLLSEPFAHMGYNITGLDASTSTIEIAKAHAKEQKLNIEYLNLTAEEYLASNQKKFDVIFAMEIIEHVNSPINFIKTISSMLKPNGLLFVSTINRNLKSLLLAKISAEYILNWLPKGTHNYNQFITPAELNAVLEANQLQLSHINGINFNVLSQSWNLHKNPEVNYILCAKKL